MGGGGGGGTTSFEVVLTQELEVLAILIGGVEKVSTLSNGGCEKFYPVLRGDANAKFWTHNFPIF